MTSNLVHNYAVYWLSQSLCISSVHDAQTTGHSQDMSKLLATVITSEGRSHFEHDSEYHVRENGERPPPTHIHIHIVESMCNERHKNKNMHSRSLR